MRQPDPDEQLSHLLGWGPAELARYRDGPEPDWPDEYEWTGDEFWNWPGPD